MITKVIMPEMGEGVLDGTVARWLVHEGDFVKQYDPILEIETDKVTTEATAEEAGTILKICVQEGDVIAVGAVLAYIGEPGEPLPENGETATHVPPETTTPLVIPTQPRLPELDTTDAVPEAPAPARYAGRISPVVGRIAAEHSVDLNEVVGTGRDGRITKSDVLRFIEEPHTATPVSVPAAPPVTDEAAISPRSVMTEAVPTAPPLVGAPTPVSPTAVPGEIMALTNMRRSIAAHMVRSKQTSPHVTTIFEIDFTRADTHRRANKGQYAHDGAHLTFTAYIVAAAVAALRAHPLVNSQWSEGGIELKREINVGIAAAIDDGLIVPVLKNAESLNLLGLARTLNDLTQRARAGSLQPSDVQNGTFSITNHGVSGSLFANPIINQPQCAILGVGKIEKRVKVIHDAIAIRTLAYVGLTFDHRILDGALADHFMNTFKDAIEGW